MTLTIIAMETPKFPIKNITGIEKSVLSQAISWNEMNLPGAPAVMRVEIAVLRYLITVSFVETPYPLSFARLTRRAIISRLSAVRFAAFALVTFCRLSCFTAL